MKNALHALSFTRRVLFFILFVKRMFYLWMYLSLPGGVKVAKMLDCDIVLHEFELQSRCHVHVQTYTLEKCMNPLIPPAID